mmetsp:Transcript_94037/g.162649  ORF Transcript_94037/g.162649 Transcript_94037/m.162649 type:complete len:178 (+) Transcript_94037:732-1265(+)
MCHFRGGFPVGYSWDFWPHSKKKRPAETHKFQLGKHQQHPPPLCEHDGCNFDRELYGFSSLHALKSLHPLPTGSHSAIDEAVHPSGLYLVLWNGVSSAGNSMYPRRGNVSASRRAYLATLLHCCCARQHPSVSMFVAAIYKGAYFRKDNGCDEMNLRRCIKHPAHASSSVCSWNFFL